MSNPTTPFSWQMPTATDLVTDLPADFEVFGQAVATSMADLLGGTTGQVLSKTTNADMDFTWVAANPGDITAVTAGTGISGGGTSGAVTITNSMATEITAKGDLIAGTGSATFDNLPVGTNGQTLVADSSTATGLKWATASGGGKVLQVVSANITTDTTIATTTYTDTNLTATITPTSATSKILVIFSQQVRLSSAAAGTELGMKLFRGATVVADLSLGSSARALAIEAGGASSMGIACFIGYNYLDSPATTSATTYKTQSALSTTSGGRSSRFQIQDMPSVITLMEIGA
jgi:hypothetical protein